MRENALQEEINFFLSHLPYVES